MKKAFKFLLKVFLGIIAFIVLYGIAAYSLSKITVEEEKNSSPDLAIYILTNGVHTDLVLPVHTDSMDWSRLLPYANILSKDSNYAYIAFGWGDKGFYLQTPEWKDLKASVAFRAMFGLSTTAIHTTYHHELVESEHCRKIMLSKTQYQRLSQYILSSFQLNEDNKFSFISTNAVYGQDDAFYEAQGRYHLFHTCNTWANNGLKEAGLRCCFWTPHCSAIFEKYSNTEQ